MYEICPRFVGCRVVSGETKCATFQSASECSAVCRAGCSVADVYVGQKTYSPGKSIGELKKVSYCAMSDSKLEYATEVVPLPDPVSVCKSVLTLTSGTTQEQLTVTQKCPQSIACSADGVFTSLDVYASSDIYKSVQQGFSAVRITG